ncbi:hypothetical protein BJ875DRAFT_442545 [Amylocarpus encephaloides]|uniref:Uncharacterized protein n=1 Tax=Amylocarpus encephaloides TaxID=45428 RepID=A0A9P7YGJ6_9HELO|nr:hypothetical protein BJ875DRAFT_442545 [Amylocarpus encephaloides]
MSTEQAKGCWRGLNPDEQIEAALRDRLSEDRYERKYPGSDLRNMEDMKHITKAVRRSTPGRLDKELKRVTIKTQRKTNLTIPLEVHDSVAPEICKAKYKKDGELEIKISFKREFTKGIPKHLLYEMLKPAPPLSANGLLFLLAIIISAGAFRDYSSVKDVLATRPPPSRKYRIMD